MSRTYQPQLCPAVLSLSLVDFRNLNSRRVTSLRHATEKSNDASWVAPRQKIFAALAMPGSYFFPVIEAWQQRFCVVNHRDTSLSAVQPGSAL